MVLSQAIRSPGDPAINPGQGDEAINKPSTSCASIKTATTLTRSKTWNLIVAENDGHHATIVIPCSYGKRQCDTDFDVVETPGPVTLGLPTPRDVNLVTLNYTVTKGVAINSTETDSREV